MSGQCDIEELLFRTGLIPLMQRFVYVSYIFYKLIFLTAKYHLIKILYYIHIATGKHVHRQSLLPVHPLYKVDNVYTCIAFVPIWHQTVSGSILCFWTLMAVFSSSTPATLIELILNIAQISMG